MMFMLFHHQGSKIAQKTPVGIAAFLNGNCMNYPKDPYVLRHTVDGRFPAPPGIYKTL